MFSSFNSGGLMVLTEGVIAPFAAVITMWAIMLGPVSLVVTLLSARPLFVFLLSAVLSTRLLRLLDEPLDRATLSVKAVSIAMIVAGVITISIL